MSGSDVSHHSYDRYHPGQMLPCQWDETLAAVQCDSPPFATWTWYTLVTINLTTTVVTNIHLVANAPVELDVGCGQKRLYTRVLVGATPYAQASRRLEGMAGVTVRETLTGVETIFDVPAGSYSFLFQWQAGNLNNYEIDAHAKLEVIPFAHPGIP